MNLDELRSAQNAERNKSGLQSLRESFYAEAGEYVASLKEQRERAAQRADDPFSDPEVKRLSDEIETAEEVIEAIYERRMGKLLKRASLAASEMTVDEEGLTAEERDLFHDLVERIRANKSTVLDTVAGEDVDASDPTSPDADADPTSPGADADPTSPGADADRADRSPGTDRGSADGSDGVSAADAMGGADPVDPVGDPSLTDDPGDRSPEGRGRPDGEAEAVADPAGEDSGGRDRTGDDPVGGDPDPGEDRVTLRITRDVGEILGVDDRQYELASEDVVQLPEQNAEPLVQRDAAERLE